MFDDVMAVAETFRDIFGMTENHKTFLADFARSQGAGTAYPGAMRGEMGDIRVLFQPLP